MYGIVGWKFQNKSDDNEPILYKGLWLGYGVLTHVGVAVFGKMENSS